MQKCKLLKQKLKILNQKYREKLEETVHKLDIEKNVLMPGSVSDLYDKIKCAELFVLSSDYEGMPNALIEAMCLGMAVISTKVSGATDLIKHEENGLLVDVGDTDSFTEAMIELLSDKKKRDKLATSAAKLSEGLLPERILEQWKDIIRRHI